MDGLFRIFDGKYSRKRFLKNPPIAPQSVIYSIYFRRGKNLSVALLK